MAAIPYLMAVKSRHPVSDASCLHGVEGAHASGHRRHGCKPQRHMHVQGVHVCVSVVGEDMAIGHVEVKRCQRRRGSCS